MAAALALTAPAACARSTTDKAGSTATLATEPAPTTTTNPYAIPPVIDVAYVNRVLAGLDAVTGDVVRLVYRSRTIPTEAVDRLQAVYAAPDVLQLTIDGLQIDMRADFKNYRSDVGNKISTVTRLITARPDCIFAQVQRDYSAISIDQSAVVNPQWVGLKRLDTPKDAAHYNPTSWAYIYDGFTRDRSQPTSPCAS